jgi:3-deoxy-D-manno-octulosonate 8-phosphate phosphatase (KDO 8-P phosphatase)
MDVDGVLTDGGIYLNDEGIESKRFSTRDGLGLFWVRKYGLKTGVISGRRSRATELRCQDLQMDEIHLGVMHKVPLLDGIIQRTGIDAAQIAYIGDDLIDLSFMRIVGLGAAPSDAHPEILRQVDLILDYPGGNGAIRHFLDLWLAATGQWNVAVEELLHGKF